MADIGIPPLVKPKGEMQLGDWISHYIECRDARDALKKQHTEELGPFKERMDKLELLFQRVMQQQNLSNLKTDNGTAYTSEVATVKVEDWDSFRDWVVMNEAWHFLEARAAKKSVEELLESEGELPPGIRREAIIKVNVRRS